MNGTIELMVVSPAQTLLQTTARGVQIPALNGEFGVLPNHAAIVVQLKPGMVKIVGHEREEAVHYFVADGFFQIRDNKATLIAETIEAEARIDHERAGRAEGRAQQRLASKDSAVDISRALGALARAKARLKLAELSQKR